jgi:hypothetical protein
MRRHFLTFVFVNCCPQPVISPHEIRRFVVQAEAVLRCHCHEDVSLSRRNINRVERRRSIATIASAR